MARRGFTKEHKQENRVVFLLGLPYPSGSISYSVEEELLNIKLLSICPPEAQRLYFQEGNLLGTFPTKIERKHYSQDWGRRIFAKFSIPNSSVFWCEVFGRISNSALFPFDDLVLEMCNSLVDKAHELTRHIEEKRKHSFKVKGIIPK